VTRVGETNRWRRWARHLQARHGRRELGRPADAMILARGMRSHTRVLVSAPRTSVSLHVRVAVRLLASAPTGMTAPNGAVPRSPAETILHETRSILGGRASRSSVRSQFLQAQGPVYRSSPTFVDASSVHVTGAVEVRPCSQLHELVRLWGRQGRPAAVARRAAELPARLRQSAARREVAAPEPARILSAVNPHRTEGAGAREPDAAREATTSVTSVQASAALPPGPGLNVEALTSQVLQQMDRRLVAYRERMGRG